MDVTPAAPQLALVIPVYNEEFALPRVLTEWRDALRKTVDRFVILVINDGSTDGTLGVLQALDWPELRVHSHSNRGHGQSCLVGYRQAARLGAEFVFQIDSDGQCDPVSFAALWAKRSEAPAVYGRRVSRDDGFGRRVISTCLRSLLKVSRRTRLNDTNVPYRLYRTELAAQAAESIPPTFDLANIAVALRLENKGFVEVPIHFRDRIGGHPSVRYLGFAKKARRLLRDLRTLDHHA